MALTTKRVEINTVGDRRHVTADLTFDNSYPAGGYPLTGATLGVTSPVVSMCPAITDDGYICKYVRSTGKLKVFKVGSAGPLTEAGSTDLNTKTVRIVLVVH